MKMVLKTNAIISPALRKVFFGVLSCVANFSVRSIELQDQRTHPHQNRNSEPQRAIQANRGSSTQPFQ